MVTYFSENLKEDIVNCAAKWILVPWGLYNPYSGVTNNSAGAMVTYFSENLKEDIVNCAAKWILVPWGLYNPYSKYTFLGVTNNSAAVGRVTL